MASFLGINWPEQFVLFVVVTVIATYVGRRFLRPSPKGGHDINDLAPRLLGKEGEAVGGFSAGLGRVFVDGKEWAAELDGGGDLGAKSKVEVVAILGGARLKVRPACASLPRGGRCRRRRRMRGRRAHRACLPAIKPPASRDSSSGAITRHLLPRGEKDTHFMNFTSTRWPIRNGAPLALTTTSTTRSSVRWEGSSDCSLRSPNTGAMRSTAPG